MLEILKKSNTFTHNTQDTIYNRKNQEKYNFPIIIIIIRCNLTRPNSLLYPIFCPCLTRTKYRVSLSHVG